MEKNFERRGNLKVLLSYIVASGGMDTLNRTRAEALREHGIQCHLHYKQAGAGLQNKTSCPIYVTNDDTEIQQLLLRESFQVIIVSSDFSMLETFRKLGFGGPLIYEAQGLGTLDAAQSMVQQAEPYIMSYANALLYPPTSHLVELFSRFSTKLHYSYPNCIDTGKFQFRDHIPTPYPIVGWVGRLEPNKNWMECLEIVSRLALHEPQLRLWLFEDSNLSTDSERLRFQETLMRLGLHERIEVFSNVPHDEMPYYFSVIGESGGFLLSTSMVEGFGYAVGEAISCLCPVLSTDSDGVRHFIHHDQTGKFYALGEIDQAVREGLELLRGDHRAQMRAKGRTLMESSFSPAAYAAHFIGMVNHQLSFRG